MSNLRYGRYLMIGGTFLLSLLLYIDRICISVAKDPIAGELGLSDKMMGWVLSAFALGYAVFQTPGGLLSDFETSGEDYLKNILVQEAVYKPSLENLPITIQ